MAIYPVVSRQPPAAESHQYYGQTGRMLISDQSRDWTRDEYRAQTATVARGCFGVFDTAIPEQKHFGRTLDEILANVAAGQFCLMADVMYRWVQSKQRGARVLVFVQWVEIRDMPKTDVQRQASRGAIRVMAGN